MSAVTWWDKYGRNQARELGTRLHNEATRVAAAADDGMLDASIQLFDAATAAHNLSEQVRALAGNSRYGELAADRK